MPRHLTEELSIENLEEDVESIETREESVEPEEVVEQHRSPTLEELRSIYRVDPVQIEELEFEDPIPLPNQIPNKIPNQNQPSKKPNRSNPSLKHFCRLLLNGQPFETEIPSSVWNSWQKSGDSILFPENYIVSLIVENRDSLPLKDLIVEICGKYVDKKTIPPNSSARFIITSGIKRSTAHSRSM